MDPHLLRGAVILRPAAPGVSPPLTFSYESPDCEKIRDASRVFWEQSVPSGRPGFLQYTSRSSREIPRRGHLSIYREPVFLERSQGHIPFRVMTTKNSRRNIHGGSDDQSICIPSVLTIRGIITEFYFNTDDPQPPVNSEKKN